MAASTTYALLSPAGPDALVASVEWLRMVLTGRVATMCAVIAVAWIGMLAMTGRVALRRGVQVIVGCFVLFGAPAIVAGLESAVGGNDRAEVAMQTPPGPPPPILPQVPAYDPSAGAGVPVRQ